MEAGPECRSSVREKRPHTASTTPAVSRPGSFARGRRRQWAGRRVDAAAHKGAIEARGKTIAVIGTPLDKVYPAKNRQLQTRLMRAHLVLSQFPSGHAVHPKNFPMRNRTMALLSHATIIVEAADDSGALHQGGKRFAWVGLVRARAPDERPQAFVAREVRPLWRACLQPTHLEAMSEYLPEHGRADLVPIDR